MSLHLAGLGVNLKLMLLRMRKLKEIPKDASRPGIAASKTQACIGKYVSRPREMTAKGRVLSMSVWLLATSGEAIRTVQRVIWR